MRIDPSSRLFWFVTGAGTLAVTGVVLASCGVLPVGDLPELPGADEEAAPSPSPEPTTEQASFVLPASCAEIGAEELAGELVPAGAVVDEQAAEVEGHPDAEQLSCVWHAGTDVRAESFSLVFTLNVDPTGRAQVVRLPGAQEEMNWEVDVDVDVDSYRSAEADALGGELEYVSTVEGSSRNLYLSLPGEFHVSVTAMYSEATREEMERVVIAAAERARA
ncbi:hypothetical protein [Marinitenerispora sediminis]|uniref:hypothetical protein n=1 Tax=Marinitenerispora sediminis TaxID=1931232 RepID=UPI000DF35C68|nr:hypothetical protein [Marinitenerispora sediminis]